MQNETINKLMQGAYDMHIHVAPSPFNRLMDEFQLLKEADEAGMAGVVLKSHYEPTENRAIIANKYSGVKTKAYGAIVLNWPVGGLNPYAVHNALKRGTAIVFMPTRDAANSLCFGNMDGDFFNRPGISIFNEDKSLKAEVLTILDVVKQYNGVLATGHLSTEESIALCEEGCKRGVRMILTHPEFSRTTVDWQTQKRLAEQGVYIEKCWYNVSEKEIAAEKMAENIKKVGAEHCFLSTDRGQGKKEHPVAAMEKFIQMLLDNGISEKEIYTMNHTVPEKILDKDEEKLTVAI